MVNSLIFDNNVFSENIIRSYFYRAKVNVYNSYSRRVDVLSQIVEHEPDICVIDYYLYNDCLLEMLKNINRYVPSCEIIIVADKMSKMNEFDLIEKGVKGILKRPFVDADFIELIIR